MVEKKKLSKKRKPLVLVSCLALECCEGAPTIILKKAIATDHDVATSLSNYYMRPTTSVFWMGARSLVTLLKNLRQKGELWRAL